MNDAAKQWVAALRSGKYKQAQGRLRVEDAYCCLGVACVLFGIKLRRKSKAMSLPAAIQLKLGLANKEGGYGRNSMDNYLSNLNDSGESFAQIADIIESEPEGLFVQGAQR